MNLVDSGDTSTQPPVPWRLSGALADLERGGESEFVRDLIDAFLRDSAERVASMRKAAASADLDALATAATRILDGIPAGSAPPDLADRAAVELLRAVRGLELIALDESDTCCGFGPSRNEPAALPNLCRCRSCRWRRRSICMAGPAAARRSGKRC